MKRKTKQVVLFIVEGATEETALGGVLKSFFSSEEISFQLVRGDITIDPTISASNAKNKVNEQVKAFIKRNRVKRSDICQIVHIIDTDGAFVPDENVELCEAATMIQYEVDCIRTDKLQSTHNRMAKKSEVVQRLITTNVIQNAPYKIYYFSRNMEHALHNVAENCTEQEKVVLADELVNKYASEPEDFRVFITDLSMESGEDYKATWEFIFKDTNSLHRHTNIAFALPAEEDSLVLPEGVEINDS